MLASPDESKLPTDRSIPNSSFLIQTERTVEPMKVYKYGANVDTDVIIPARHLNDPSPAALASHCMEDIDPYFASTV